MDRVRLAIVGCGNICQLNAPGYLEHPRCDVVALCDTEWARAQLRARQWGITPRIYKDYAELLDDSTVDAVELLTRSSLVVVWPPATSAVPSSKSAALASVRGTLSGPAGLTVPAVGA